MPRSSKLVVFALVASCSPASPSPEHAVPETGPERGVTKTTEPTPPIATNRWSHEPSPPMSAAPSPEPPEGCVDFRLPDQQDAGDIDHLDGECMEGTRRCGPPAVPGVFYSHSACCPPTERCCDRGWCEDSFCWAGEGPCPAHEPSR
jgi:hypothetical protein